MKSPGTGKSFFKRRAKLGGPFFGPWIFLAAAVAASVLVSSLLGEDYGAPGGVVRIRHWMQLSNLALLLLHVLALSPILWVCWRRSRVAPSLAGRLALAGFAGAMLAVLGAAALDPLMGQGPWPMDATQLQVLRHAVFLPCVVRSVAWLALIWVAVRPGVARGMLVGLVSVDLAVGVWLWASTPLAVMARLHPGAVDPIWTAPFFVASLVFVVCLARSSRSGRPGGGH